ncbi:hypothetical protein F5Y15DRAFT_207149 [Xylariaceae sp. FL0016]|nr:hypothetical protein F5Y15DRAFT_207149 [Xylariaceae sp. FL0016]
MPGQQEVSSSTSADLTDLPYDVFLLIISYLSPQDSVLCRTISRAWNAAFTREDVLRDLMRWHFPRCREMRATAQSYAGVEMGAARPPWSRIFARVARRYFHLRSAKPRMVEKIDVVQEEARQEGSYLGVEPWNRWLRWNGNSAVFQYRDPTWCLEDGLLVYMEGVSGRCLAYDIETRRRMPVPFDLADKMVRRVRLAGGVLVLEWCDREPYHQLNDRETVHRHFATAFDVRRLATVPGAAAGACGFGEQDPWRITFRSEWKIHFLGLPPNRLDRFFSAHTARHYALYLWQPNRSPWGEDDPLEQLTIWDISSPAAYRPSLDPRGAKKPEGLLEGKEGPVVVNRFTWRDLDVLGLRQRNTPSLREILLDDANVYVHEEEHRWLAGQHSSLSPPRHHHVRCTGIPFHGMGPRWFDECCADGDVHMSFCPRAGSVARLRGKGSNLPESPDGLVPTEVASLKNVKAASPDGDWPGWAPCWRHEEFPYLTVSDAVDVAAGVRIVARQCFMMEALSAFVLPKLSVEETRLGHRRRPGRDNAEEEDIEEVRFADEMWTQLMGKGKIAGDERWVVGEDEAGKVTVVRF